MFDDILDYLENEDLTAYPIPGNLDLPGYTLESAVEDMLYSILKDAEGPYIKYTIIDLINTIGNGSMSWQGIYNEMKNFEE